jgi:hypothetical protein
LLAEGRERIELIEGMIVDGHRELLGNEVTQGAFPTARGLRTGHSIPPPAAILN